jgi:hypothetical protein
MTQKEISPHAIDAAVVPDDTAKSTYEHSTGEEHEDVELELKGVKLFINRGNAGFGGGMMGHIKLLSDKVTLAERLLFRREPLWQVSMNIQMRPSIRCSYDAEESVLRVTLKELIQKENVSRDDWKSEVVVYALKSLARTCLFKEGFQGVCRIPDRELKFEFIDDRDWRGLN